MGYNDRLFVLLRQLDDEQLNEIWVDALRCDPARRDFNRVARESRIELISREWRSAHGHSLANLVRDWHALSWKRMLIDVADKLKPGWGWTSYQMSDGTCEEEIEEEILTFLNHKAEQAMSANARERPGDAAKRQEDALHRARDAAVLRAQGIQTAAAVTATVVVGRGIAMLVSAPLSVALLANTVMAPAYRKSIHAMMLLLTRVEWNRMMRANGDS